MLKLWRNYRAEFEIGERTPEGELIPKKELVITLPFTLQFQTNSGINNTASNTAVLQFINLGEDNKTLLWLDLWNYANKYIYLRLYAGYGNDMPLIFAGFALRSYSYKNGGSTEYITEMQMNSNELLLQSDYFNVTFSTGTKFEDIIKYMTADNKYISAGHITPDISPLKRDRTYIGQTLDLIQRENGGYDVYIANGELNVLADRDVIPGEIQAITDESGLLGSPKRTDGWVQCDLMFEPNLRAGQAITLNSVTSPWLNRVYKIVQVGHKGIISPNASGQVITTVDMALFPIKEKPRELKKETKSYTPPPKKGVWDKPTKLGKITSFFGKRNKPNAKASSNHKGIDIGVPINTPVFASEGGRVAHVSIEGGNISLKKGYGLFIIIDHGNGLSSLYAHLNKGIVNVGQTVGKGEQIAYSGNSGNSTGAHLHFGVKSGDVFINPIDYIGAY